MSLIDDYNKDKARRKSIFAGRKKELDLFQRKIKDGQTPPVWNVSGIGGVGKTRLLEKFAELAKDRLPVFIESGQLSSSSLLLMKAVVDQIEKKAKGKHFKEFRALWDDVHNTLSSNSETVKSVFSKYGPAIKDTGALVMDTFIPALGTGSKIIIDMLIKKLKERNPKLTTESLQQIKKFEELCFRNFINEIPVEKEGGRQFVLLIDNYDPGTSGLNDFFTELILESDRKFLFIISGRNKVFTKEYIKQEPLRFLNKEKLVDSYQLQSFEAEGESRDYLKQREITEKDVQDALINFSNGFPLYLEFAADIIEEAKEKGKDIPGLLNDFKDRSVTTHDLDEYIIDNFLIEKVNNAFEEKDLKGLVYELSVPRKFSLPILNHLVNGEPGELRKIFKQLTKYSFVRSEGSEGKKWYSFHDRIRDAAYRHYKDFTKEFSGIHKKMSEYYSTQENHDKKENQYHQYYKDPVEVAKSLYERVEDLIYKELDTLTALDLLTDFNSYFQYFPLEISDRQKADILTYTGVMFWELPVGDRFSHLNNAVSYHKEAGDLYRKEERYEGYAMTKNNLGNAYWALSGMFSGDEKKEMLNNSVSAYKEALEIRTKEKFPVDYATTQNNLGNVYGDLADMLSGEKRMQMLNKAVVAYKEALEIRTKEKLPVKYAATQNNLGATYWELSGMLSDDEKKGMLNNSVLAYKEALEIRTKEKFPVKFATTQNNIGIAYKNLAGMFSGDEREEMLKNAVTACKEALEITTKEQFPVDYAQTQYNLGNTYGDLAGMLSGDEKKEMLNNSVKAYKEALEIYTNEKFPVKYAMTQNNLGNVYRDLSGMLSGVEKEEMLKNAVLAYKEALSIWTEQKFPHYYKSVMKNLKITEEMLSE